MIFLRQSVPDVERNGHHRVEDDDVGPEGEEGRETSVDPRFTREEGCEHRALLHLPDCIADGQSGAHGRQETKNLMDRRQHTSRYVVKCLKINVFYEGNA